MNVGRSTFDVGRSPFDVGRSPFDLRAWTNHFDQWVVIRSELGVAVYAALRGAGMEIPFPQREVRLREG